MTVVLVCGGRAWGWRRTLSEHALREMTDEEVHHYEDDLRDAAAQRNKTMSVLDRVHEAMGISEIVHGDARGADRLAQRWAEKNGVSVRVFPADWTKHGRAAGPLRNQKMLDEGAPDLVVAFPGGHGTDDMRQRADETGVRLVSVFPSEIA